MTTTTSPSTPLLLNVYGLYRLLVACSLTLFFWLEGSEGILGQRFPSLFTDASSLYLILSLIGIRYWQRVGEEWQRHVLFAGFLIDTLFLVIALHTSATTGVTALSLLCVITVASATMVLGNPLALVIASLFVLGLLTDGLVSQGYPTTERIDLYSSGLFSAFLMLTAVAVDRFAHYLHVAEQKAAQSTVEKAAAEKLNQLILQQLNTGVMLLHNDEILALNKGAERALNIDKSKGQPKRLPPAFQQQYDRWKGNPETPLPTLTTRHDHQELHLQFKTVASDAAQYTMLFLENARKASQQAQQLKLASLGRLTASIAHEIRNPLASIKHAAELLEETTQNEEDKYLLAIIDKQARRMNSIIENIQNLSRGQIAPRQIIELNKWLEHFATQFNEQQHGAIKLQMDQHDVQINFDPGQLQQVLDNLCGNALRYTQTQSDGHSILLHLQYVDRLHRFALAVIDYGEPIHDDQVPHLFEPFYTTEHKGTGLGLYICRELCLSNQASLDYRCGGRRRKSFSILFSKQ